MSLPVGYRESPYERLKEVHWGGVPMAVIKVTVFHYGTYDTYGYPDVETPISSNAAPDDGEFKHEDVTNYCCTTGNNTDGIAGERDIPETTRFTIQDYGTPLFFDSLAASYPVFRVVDDLRTLTPNDVMTDFVRAHFLGITDAEWGVISSTFSWATFDYDGHGVDPTWPGGWGLAGYTETFPAVHETAHYSASVWVCDFSAWNPRYPDYSGTAVAEHLPEGKFSVRRWIVEEFSPDLDIVDPGLTDTWELAIFPAGTVFTIAGSVDYTASKPPTFTGTRTSSSFGDVETIFTFDKNGFVP